MAQISGLCTQRSPSLPLRDDAHGPARAKLNTTDITYDCRRAVDQLSIDYANYGQSGLVLHPCAWDHIWELAFQSVTVTITMSCTAQHQLRDLNVDLLSHRNSSPIKKCPRAPTRTAFHHNAALESSSRNFEATAFRLYTAFYNKSWNPS
jgi:hypothetical protein